MFVKLAALCVMAIFSAAIASAGERAASTVRIENPTAIMSTPRFGAAYGSITLAEPDTLTGASSNCCTAVEIHQSRMNNGVMQMRKLDAVAAKADRPILFVPHGKAGGEDSMHLMLIGAKEPLKPGDSFDITLHFAKAGKQTARFNVAKPAAQAQDAAHAHDAAHGHE